MRDIQCGRKLRPVNRCVREFSCSSSDFLRESDHLASGRPSETNIPLDVFLREND
jgi:hypothetical protein